MSIIPTSASTGETFDRVNAAIAGFILALTALVYWNTVQPTLSFWDCGEFIACSYILGIPHPPGSPLFIIIGRLFSVFPIVADVALRVNLISVISSGFAAMFGYLVVVRMVELWYPAKERNSQTRLIGYIGGGVGALFLAFSRTNWGNAVEAEVYGLTLMLTLAIFWLALRFFVSQGEPRSFRYLALAIYLAILGIGIHMTVFLAIPVAAIFFIIQKGAPRINWIYLCSFFVVELILVTLLSFGDIPKGYFIFLAISAAIFAYLAYKLYHTINIPYMIALGAAGLIMLGFWKFAIGLFVAALVIFIYGRFVPRSTWRSALVIVLLAFMGFSVNMFIPIRSTLNPRIDENNPSKSFETFINFLERKQYGSMSMTERMFNRRGLLENQFGRHPHMGFWSYFEEQYSPPRALFAPFFLLGLFGIYWTMRKKMEIGYPFFVLLLLMSVGLILYMNFADGMRYDPSTNDAYLEVRNRDYFFTPAFMFFGLAIGLGVSALIELARSRAPQALRGKVVIASTVTLALGYIPFAHSYAVNDRSQNYIPYDYANNILSSVPENGILFTSGDNDTFPLWAMQEAYRIRRDVKVANLSLLNTDWYVAQMKNRFGIPMDLTDSQIVWETFEINGRTAQRPPLMFNDRARQRRTYLMAQAWQGGTLKVQDMMVDEIALSARFQNLNFTSEPYAESPLRLRERKNVVGVVNRLTLTPRRRAIEVDSSYDLYMNTFKFRGLDNPDVYKDDNATGVLVSIGFGAVRVFTEYMALANISGEVRRLEALKGTDDWNNDKSAELDSMYAAMDGKNPADSAYFEGRAVGILEKMIVSYPEFWMNYVLLADLAMKQGDSDRALEYVLQGEENLTRFHEKSPDNANYMQDLGLVKHEIAKFLRGADDQNRLDESLELLWDGFMVNQNSSMAYQKLLQYLYERQRNSEIIRATKLHAQYKLNYYNNPSVQGILRQAGELNLE